MPTLAIILFALAGFGVLFGILIADAVAHRRHTRWIEANSRRRHGLTVEG
jgi:hypothetical protein